MRMSKLSSIAGVGAVTLATAFLVGPGTAQAGGGLKVTGVPSANPAFGIENNVLTPSASQRSVAWGALPLTNPDTANGVTHYGYNTSNGGPLTQAVDENNKTEPDKNVYLVFNGKHYLYQGHELGPRGYVTRINLDETDPAKRVTLISDVDANGAAFPTIDGITWDPYSHQLLITAEFAAPKGGVFAISLDGNGDPVDGKAVSVQALGSGGFEGIQNDKDGRLWVVEDIGGASVGGGRVPNSYIYRFLPTDPSDLSQGGTMQALQILRKDGTPATAAQLQADPTDPFITQLHTPGMTFHTAWVTVHTGTGTFAATAAAAAAEATPLKRPENGVFRPGTNFTEFFFTETGDTSATSTLPGAFGGVFQLRQTSPGADSGSLRIAAVGDVTHTGLDNLAFASKDDLLVVEDAGDSLHTQRNALDSGYLVDVGKHAKSWHSTKSAFVRWLAEGRDASATFDSITPGPTYNDKDNEITGIHVSNGDPGVSGILGTTVPHVRNGAWRTFWTQQHGDNVTWEITWR